MAELVPAVGAASAPEKAAPTPPLERLIEVLPAGPEAVPAENLRLPGAAPNFSGASDDARLVELWLKDFAPKTRAAYAHELMRFFDVTGSKPLGLTTLADLQDFADSIAEMLAPRTQRKTLAAVKSLFTFANRTGYIPYNVGAALRLPPVKDDLAERELTEAEVHKLINAPFLPDPKRKDGKPGPFARRDHAILLTLYAGGLRREDVCVLKWRDVKDRDDVAPGAGQITVYGKGSKTGTVLLPPSVYAEVLALRRSGGGKGDGQEEKEPAGPDEPVFPSRKKNTPSGGHLDVSMINRIVTKAAERAKIKGNVSPHWLRHSHATHAERRGAKLSLVQKTLRHSSLATTGRYLHANPTESSAMYLGL
ncbi:MAG: tyrosine-type recombinase/integrase [Actinomycetota bacterium]|nr:tyrosine-type recombinase/integrase [Actinomycetota bacterium]